MHDTLVIIPAYNESRNIGNVLQSLLEQVRDADILVVNDGSVDETELTARRYGVTVVSHPCNMGYGSALQTGYKYALLMGYACVVQFDADGQHNPEDIDRIRAQLTVPGTDVVIGSRFLADAHFSPGTMKMMAIHFFRAVIRGITKTSITDPTSGLRGLSRRAFSLYSQFEWFPADFPDADILIDILLHGRTVVEVPVRSQVRHHGTSMHAGLKPIVYMFKVSLSILVVVVNYLIERRDLRSE